MDDAPSRPPRVTIHDVALAAGVSVGTVSKALNKGTTIAPGASVTRVRGPATSRTASAPSATIRSPRTAMASVGR